MTSRGGKGKGGGKKGKGTPYPRVNRDMVGRSWSKPQSQQTVPQTQNTETKKKPKDIKIPPLPGGFNRDKTLNFEKFQEGIQAAMRAAPRLNRIRSMAQTEKTLPPYTKPVERATTQRATNLGARTANQLPGIYKPVLEGTIQRTTGLAQSVSPQLSQAGAQRVTGMVRGLQPKLSDAGQQRATNMGKNIVAPIPKVQVPVSKTVTQRARNAGLYTALQLPNAQPPISKEVSQRAAGMALNIDQLGSKNKTRNSSKTLQNFSKENANKQQYNKGKGRGYDR